MDRVAIRQLFRCPTGCRGYSLRALGDQSCFQPASVHCLGIFHTLVCPGMAPGQLYTYPARCWRKKRRLNILEDPRLRPCEIKLDTEVALKKEGLLPEGPALEALLCAEAVEKKTETKDEESISECQRILASDFPHEVEAEDLEEDAPKRKNKTKGRTCGIGGMRKRQEPTSLEDRDKPYVCDMEFDATML
ncbi:zinc finger protein neuro-d4-like [Mustelus asterias]